MEIEYPVIEKLKNGLIVSCQAGPESPLNAPHFIAAMAKSAEMGGAFGFRVDRPENVRAVRACSSLPILGINKIMTNGYEVYITPTFQSAKAVVEAGADLVAIDGTNRFRNGGETAAEIVATVHGELGVPVMADIGNVDEGLRCLDEGFDIIATTLSTSHPYGKNEDGPGLHIVRELTRVTNRPIIVEGGIWTLEHVRACFEAGAFAIVIGSAITVPQFITHRFLTALPQQLTE